MRKSLSILLLLSAAGIALLALAASAITDTRERVAVHVETLAGDPAAAEGISVTLRSKGGSHLRWDTTVPFGRPDVEPETRFTMNQAGWQRFIEMASSVDVYSQCDVGYSGNAIDLSAAGLPAPILDLAARTPAGETRKEIVKLNETEKTYPLQLSLYVKEHPEWMTGELEQSWMQDLRIPVPDAHRVQIAVARDDAGNVTEASCTTLSEALRISSSGVASDAGCFFVLMALDFDGHAVQLPDSARGLFGLLPRPGGNGGKPDVSCFTGLLQLVRTADDELPFQVLKSTDGSRLFLFSMRGESLSGDDLSDSAEPVDAKAGVAGPSDARPGNAMVCDDIILTTIDAVSGETLRKETIAEGLGAESETQSLPSVSQQGNLMLLCCGSDRFVLLEEVEGAAVPRMEGTDADDAKVIAWNNGVMAYDGSRLAIACRSLGVQSEFQLTVHDESGLRFKAKCTTGLMNAATGLEPVVTDDECPLMISMD